MIRAICDRCHDDIHNIDMLPFRRTIISLKQPTSPDLEIMMETTVYEKYEERSPLMGGKLHFCFDCGEKLIQEHIKQLTQLLK